MKLLVDTNVLVYDTVEDSEYHSEAAKIIDDALELYIPSIVIHEYIWIMLRYLNLDPLFTLSKVEEYLEDPRTTYLAETIAILRRAFKMLVEDKAGFKEINDYIILATAMNYGLTLATFDKALRRRAVKRGVRVLP